MNTAALCIILAHSEAQRMSAHHAVLVSAVLSLPYRNAVLRRRIWLPLCFVQLIKVLLRGPDSRSPDRTDRPPRRVDCRRREHAKP